MTQKSQHRNRETIAAQSGVQGVAGGVQGVADVVQGVAGVVQGVAGVLFLSRHKLSGVITVMSIRCTRNKLKKHHQEQVACQESVALQSATTPTPHQESMAMATMATRYATWTQDMPCAAYATPLSSPQSRSRSLPPCQVNVMSKSMSASKSMSCQSQCQRQSQRCGLDCLLSRIPGPQRLRIRLRH